MLMLWLFGRNQIFLARKAWQKYSDGGSGGLFQPGITMYVCLGWHDSIARAAGTSCWC